MIMTFEHSHPVLTQECSAIASLLIAALDQPCFRIGDDLMSSGYCRDSAGAAENASPTAPRLPHLAYRTRCRAWNRGAWGAVLRS